MNGLFSSFKFKPFCFIPEANPVETLMLKTFTRNALPLDFVLFLSKKMH